MQVDCMLAIEDKHSAHLRAQVSIRHGGEHIKRLVIVDQTAFAFTFLLRMIDSQVIDNVMRVIVMMNVLNHGSYRLVVPSFMRTPCHAWHDKCANKQDEGERTEHALSHSHLHLDVQWLGVISARVQMFEAILLD